MMQPAEQIEPAQTSCRLLTNERPFWQQRTFSMASEAILQVHAGSNVQDLCLVSALFPTQCTMHGWAECKHGRLKLHMQEHSIKFRHSIELVTSLQRLEKAGEPRDQACLLVCLAAMLEALPPQLIKPQWQQLLPWMLAAVQPVSQLRPDVQASLLRSLQEALKDPYGVLLQLQSDGILSDALFWHTGRRSFV